MLNNEPVPQEIFCVNQGKFTGAHFVFINKTWRGYNFLCLPEKVNLFVNKENFQDGIKNKILESIEVLPDNVYQICEMQFLKNEKSNN